MVIIRKATDSTKSNTMTALRIIIYIFQNNDVGLSVINSALIIESETGRLILIKRVGQTKMADYFFDIIYFLIYSSKIILVK